MVARPRNTTSRSAAARLLPKSAASKVAAAAVVVAAALAGSAAAAYTGSLPAPVQNIAHRWVGAPAPDAASSTGDEPASTTSSPAEAAGSALHTPSATRAITATAATTAATSPGTGPDALGPAAFGLCAAYSRGGLATTSTAYASLLAAAGSADHIATYCAAVQNQRNTPTPPCCDVLEHVADLPQVVAETARVLQLGGLYLFDTVNRTLTSKIIAIKVMQEWRWTKLTPHALHDWKMFICPRELAQLLEANQFELGEIVGLAPRANPLSMIRNFRQTRQGKISYGELSRRLDFGEVKKTSVSYKGYARR